MTKRGPQPCGPKTTSVANALPDTGKAPGGKQ